MGWRKEKENPFSEVFFRLVMNIKFQKCEHEVQNIIKLNINTLNS